MTYYITKDCGTGWEREYASDAYGWGVSQGQWRLADRLKPGDVLIHFVDHVQVWTEYSTVTAPLRQNDRDTHSDWLAALPWVVPVEPGVHLDRWRCQLTRAIPGVSDRHRQSAFTAIPEGEAVVIVEAIKRAKAEEKPVESAEFASLWNEDAEGYYGDIHKAKAGYKCEACGWEGMSWAKKFLGGAPRPDDEGCLAGWFLEIAHIKPRHKDGRVEPDNIRALCRNCHHTIDRMQGKQRIDFMTKLRARQGTGLPSIQTQ
jgi:hypothetical protein